MYSTFINAVEQSGKTDHPFGAELIPRQQAELAGPLRVLLVEDSEADAELLINSINRGGYRPVWTRVDTAEALAAELDGRPWDVVIADYILPGFGGLAALALVHERNLDLPFIVVSGRIDETLAVAAMRAGAHDYVMKQNLARLVPAIERERREAELRRNRKSAEDASREFFKSLVEGAADSIVLTDLSGNILFLNPAARELYGTADPHELIGVVASTLLTPDSRDLADHDAAIALNTGLARDRQYTVERSDGSRILVEVTITLLRQADGRPSRLLIVARDVTARERVEEDLRLLQNSVAHLNDMVIITGPDGRVEYVNNAFERHTGYPTTEVLGRTASMLGSLAGNPQADRHLQAGAARRPGIRKEILANRRDGTTFWIDVDTSPITGRNDEITHWVSIARDITQRKTLEEQARHSQKMEAVGLLAGSMAHDFNNQLTVIKGCAQLILGTLSAEDDSWRDLQRICSTVDRGAVLIRHLLAFSRRQAFETAVVDLTQSVGEAAAMFRLLVGEYAKLVLHLAPDLWTVIADAGQIEQVLMNIVTNANDAMLATLSGKGTLTIETRNVEIAETLTSAIADAPPPGQYVLVEVADTGCGMPPEVRERIFEPFFTTKDFGKGTGLGLSTAYGIVRQHGGHILCESALGAGTTFRIFLPRATVAADLLGDSETREALPNAEPGRSLATVLIAEDEEGVRAVVGAALAQVGYTVRLASGVAEALAEAERTPIDLLVTDLVMRDGTGPVLASRLTRVNPRLRVLFMSGHPDSVVREWNIGDGSLLRKPFGLNELIRKTNQMLRT